MEGRECGGLARGRADRRRANTGRCWRLHTKAKKRSRGNQLISGPRTWQATWDFIIISKHELALTVRRQRIEMVVPHPLFIMAVVTTPYNTTQHSTGADGMVMDDPEV